MGRTQRGIIAGKLKGHIADTTPRGTRIVEVSMSAETSRDSPIIWDGIAVAPSTTCNPRSTSPFASASVFRCDFVRLHGMCGSVYLFMGNRCSMTIYIFTTQTSERIHYLLT